MYIPGTKHIAYSVHKSCLYKIVLTQWEIRDGFNLITYQSSTSFWISSIYPLGNFCQWSFTRIWRYTATDMLGMSSLCKVSTVSPAFDVTAECEQSFHLHKACKSWSVFTVWIHLMPLFWVSTHEVGTRSLFYTHCLVAKWDDWSRTEWASQNITRANALLIYKSMAKFLHGQMVLYLFVLWLMTIWHAQHLSQGQIIIHAGTWLKRQNQMYRCNDSISWQAFNHYTWLLNLCRIFLLLIIQIWVCLMPAVHQV